MDFLTTFNELASSYKYTVEIEHNEKNEQTTELRHEMNQKKMSPN